MKTKVKAITSFMHGRVHSHAGDELEVTKGEADELQKAGLVQFSDEQEEAAQPATQDPQAGDDVDDLLGDDSGAKMDEEPKNKMETAPENKGAGKKTTAKKAD